MAALLIYVIQNNKGSEQYQNLDSQCTIDSYPQTYTDRGIPINCNDGYVLKPIVTKVSEQYNLYFRTINTCVKNGIYKCPVNSRRSGNRCLPKCKRTESGPQCSSNTPICSPA